MKKESKRTRNLKTLLTKGTYPIDEGIALLKLEIVYVLRFLRKQIM